MYNNIRLLHVRIEGFHGYITGMPLRKSPVLPLGTQPGTMAESCDSIPLLREYFGNMPPEKTVCTGYNGLLIVQFFLHPSYEINL